MDQDNHTAQEVEEDRGVGGVVSAEGNGHGAVDEWDLRYASLSEERLFRHLWEEFLAEQMKMGGDIRPTEKTMEFYCGLFRDYTTGQRTGIVVFGAFGNAVLMWGEAGGDLPWDHGLGRWAMGWGTYVRPQYRHKGWAKMMRLSASEYLRENGFTSILGGPIPGNQAGMASLVEMGFAPYQETLTLRL